MRRLSGHHGRSADGCQEFLPGRRISTEWQTVRILAFAVLVQGACKIGVLEG
jgi:hypothetical protein